MTDQAKRVFLEDEGEILRIASKRKASRERARLRKAGAVFGIRDDSLPYPGWYLLLHHNLKGRIVHIGETRQEAIAYLDRMERKE